MRLIILFLFLSAIGYGQSRDTLIVDGSVGDSGYDSIGVIVPLDELAIGTGTRALTSTNLLKWTTGLEVIGTVNLNSLVAGDPVEVLYIDAAGFIGQMAVKKDSLKRVVSPVNNSTNVYAEVPDLTFQVEAGESYAIESSLLVSGTTDGYLVRINGTATADVYFAKAESYGHTDDLAFRVYDPLDPMIHVGVIHGFIRVSTSGTLGIQFNADTSLGANTATVHPGSYMRITQTDN